MCIDYVRHENKVGKKVSTTKHDKPWLCEQAFQGEEEYECVSLDDLM